MLYAGLQKAVFVLDRCLIDECPVLIFPPQCPILKFNTLRPLLLPHLRSGYDHNRSSIQQEGGLIRHLWRIDLSGTLYLIIARAHLFMIYDCTYEVQDLPPEKDGVANTNILNYQNLSTRWEQSSLYVKIS